MDFQDFFLDDYVSLKIENCPVFEGVYMTSSFSTGITGVNVKGIKRAYQRTSIWYGQKEGPCTIKRQDSLSFTVSLNGGEWNFVADLRDGRYIGLEKSPKGIIVVSQSESPFEYD